MLGLESADVCANEYRMKTKTAINMVRRFLICLMLIVYILHLTIYNISIGGLQIMHKKGPPGPLIVINQYYFIISLDLLYFLLQQATYLPPVH